MLECVVNISEGRDADLIRQLADSCGNALLDVHSDADHHRSVFTLAGDEAVRHLTRSTIRSLDLTSHVDGVHPRLGVVDVVPFVPLVDSDMDEALRARQSYAEWVAGEFGIPSFLYGDAHGSLSTARSLPEIRRHAWSTLRPDVGPDRPHPSAGAICVGARPLLVAYNIWMNDPSGGDNVSRIASAVRSPKVRALALKVGSWFQVSMNLIEPATVGPAQVHRQVHELCAGTTASIERCELVGLVPRVVLDLTPRELWETLDLSADSTIESRLHSAGLI